MIGYKLTIEQKNILIGQPFNDNALFNPVLNIDGDYFIFNEEVENCINPNYEWVKELPQAEYIAPPKPKIF